MGMKKFNKQGRKLEHNNIYFFVNGVEINNKFKSNDLDMLEHYYYDYE